MEYVPLTPIESYQPMPCDAFLTPNEVRSLLGYSEYDVPKQKYQNCPNCGAPVKGPICEYCGSVLDQAELDRQEQELAKKQRQYEEMLRRWQQSVIQAELGQFMMNRMNYYGYSMSQCCCDTRTQMMQQNIVQSPDYIPEPVPIVIKQVEQELTEYSGLSKWVTVLVGIVFVLLAAVLFASFLA